MRRLIYFGLVLTIFAISPSAHAQGACPAGAPVTGNHCYFISSSAGNDSNSGTSESAPWAHAPAMSTAAGNAAGHSYSPGEVFIFKGCDTWNFAVIGQWTPSAGGSSGNLLYFGGFDQTWYNTSVCPNGWNRPIFSGEGTWPGSDPSTGGSDYMMRLNENSYWRVAWIEWTGLHFSENVSNFTGSGGYFSCNTACTNAEFDHNFLHGFTYTLSTSCTVSGQNYPCGEPFFLSMQSTEGSIEVDHNVFGNGDIAGTCSGCSLAGDNLGLWINGSNSNSIDHNWFQGGDCFVGSFAIFHDNTMNGCGPFSAAANSVHNNTFENNSDPGSGTVMYNNLLEHDGTPGNASVSQLAPAGNTSYFFNNVIVDELSGYNGGQLPFNCAGNGGGGICVAFNNTIECGSDTAGQAPSQAPPSLQCMSNNAVNAALNINYNHFITSLGGAQCASSSSCNTNLTPSPNVTQPQSAANGQGYSLANLYSPQNGSGATVQAGYSPSVLSGLCGAVSGIYSAAGTACQSSTTAGITLLTSPYYMVGGSTAAAASRMLSGNTNNDAGAYEYNGGGSSSSGTPPAAPTGLTAVVQ